MERGFRVQSISAGDFVAWIAPEGMTTGRVIRVMTSPERVGDPGMLGTRVRASTESPYFLVQPELGGARTAFPRASLTRL